MVPQSCIATEHECTRGTARQSLRNGSSIQKRFRPVGCEKCNSRGYKGRLAVYEVMPLWDGLKELIINGSSTAELKAEAIRLGFQTLRMSALKKFKLGLTSLSEAIGNTAPDKF